MKTGQRENDKLTRDLDATMALLQQRVKAALPEDAKCQEFYGVWLDGLAVAKKHGYPHDAVTYCQGVMTELMDNMRRCGVTSL